MFGGWGCVTQRPEHAPATSIPPQNFSSPLPSPCGMLEPLVLDGKELPQVCVGAEGPEGPGCRVLFHVLPLEAGLTPDILTPPGKQQRLGHWGDGVRTRPPQTPWGTPTPAP